VITYIRTNDHATRQRIVADLEARGFTAGETGKRQILESRFPLKVNMYEKTYDTIGNVTCAAAAASSGCLLTVNEFYARNMDPR